MSPYVILIIMVAAFVAAYLYMNYRWKHREPTSMRWIYPPNIHQIKYDSKYIPDAAATAYADKMDSVFALTWPKLLEMYTPVHVRLNSKVTWPPEWRRQLCYGTLRLLANQFESRYGNLKWTEYNPGSGIWNIAINCPLNLVAEELHSMIRYYLGVYNNADAAVEEAAMHEWIRQYYGWN